MEFLKKILYIPFLFSLIFSGSLMAETNTDSDICGDNAIAAAAQAQPQTVIPGGKCVGITLNTDGVFVSSVSDIACDDGSVCSPAKKAGLHPGDMIKELNGIKISNVIDLCQVISLSNGKALNMTIDRKGNEMKILVNPVITGGSYKIGAWVKDAASGIGTITFYNPETKEFAALGHAICNPDTGEILNINGGELLDSTVVTVDKSQKGNPGELKGVFSENDSVLGEISSNTDSGICGTVTDKFSLTNTPVPLGNKDDIQIGKAYILSNVEGNLVEKFEIEIVRIIKHADSSSKNMIIEVTDENLIKQTGGIVQGMSGSPILQNDKLIGAVTHVFVNDPTKGYGIFIENMLAEVQK